MAMLFLVITVIRVNRIIIPKQETASKSELCCACLSILAKGFARWVGFEKTNVVAPPIGLGPMTDWLTASRSTWLSYGGISWAS